MKRRMLGYCRLALAAATLLVSGSSYGQCLLGPVTLPGLSGPPEWKDFNGDGFWRPELHDPRWSGAPHDFLSFLPLSGDPAWVDEVAVRAVAHGKILYLSFLVQADSTGADADDYVYVALSKGSLNNATVLKIDARSGGAAIPTPPAPPAPAELQADSPMPTELAAAGTFYYESTNATAGNGNWGAANAGLPAWAQGARWDRPSLQSPRWAITLRLDLSATGYNITGDTRLFFGAKVLTGSGDVIVGNATPITVDANNVGDTIVPNLSTSWPLFTEPGTACTTGVSLSASDAGIWTGAPGAASPGSLTSEICAGGTCGSGENVFRMTARDVPTASLGTWGLRARLRIADWGSQPAYRNSGRWREITVTPTGTNVFTAPASAFTGDPGNGWFWQDAPVDATNSTVTIDYKCKKQGTDTYCPKLVDETEDHQCMLVELGQPTPTFQFRNTAVYRNMHFEDLSTSKVPATISLEGLKTALGAAEAKDRDVYLYVEARNLPPHGEQALKLPTKDMALVRQLAENPIAVPTEPGKPGKPGALLAKPPQPVVRGAAQRFDPNVQARVAARIATSKQKLAGGVPLSNALAMHGEQLMDAVWPTYRVRAYFDSGKTFTANGKTNRILIPMVPFGFRLQHDGPLFGFTTELASLPGFTLQSLGNDWYKLVVKSESAAKVVTTITAEEKKKGEPPCPTCQPCEKCPPPVKHGHCNCRVVKPGGGVAGLFASAFLALFALARRRRRPAS